MKSAADILCNSIYYTFLVLELMFLFSFSSKKSLLQFISLLFQSYLSKVVFIKLFYFSNWWFVISNWRQLFQFLVSSRLWRNFRELLLLVTYMLGTSEDIFWRHFLSLLISYHLKCRNISLIVYLQNEKKLLSINYWENINLMETSMIICNRCYDNNVPKEDTFKTDDNIYNRSILSFCLLKFSSSFSWSKKKKKWWSNVKCIKS